MFGPGSAIKGHSERLIDQHAGEVIDSFPIKGKLIIVKVKVPYTEAFLQVFEMRIHIVGGVIAESPHKYRPVTIAAGIRTTTA